MRFFKKKQKQKKVIPTPDYWTEYKKIIGQIDLDKSTPISDLSFVVLDTETTGLRPEEDVILSVGAVKIDHEEINLAQSYHRYIKQDKYDREAATIHHIRKSSAQEGIAAEDFLKEFLPYIGSRILVAHHAGFDEAMINQICLEYTGEKLSNPIIDTSALYHRAFPRLNYGYYLREDASLDQIASKFGIKTHDRHSSIGDAYITALALLRLLALLKKKGVTTWGDLQKK